MLRVPKIISVSIIHCKDLQDSEAVILSYSSLWWKDTEQQLQRSKAREVKSKIHQIQTVMCLLLVELHRGTFNSPSSDMWQHVQSIANQGSSLELSCHVFTGVSHIGMQCPLDWPQLQHTSPIPWAEIMFAINDIIIITLSDQTHKVLYVQHLRHILTRGKYCKDSQIVSLAKVQSCRQTFLCNDQFKPIEFTCFCSFYMLCKKWK